MTDSGHEPVEGVLVGRTSDDRLILLGKDGTVLYQVKAHEPFIYDNMTDPMCWESVDIKIGDRVRICECSLTTRKD